METKRQQEAVKIMQETLQVLQVLRQEDEDLRRKLDAIKGEDSVILQRSVLLPQMTWSKLTLWQKERPW